MERANWLVGLVGCALIFAACGGGDGTAGTDGLDAAGDALPSSFDAGPSQDAAFAMEAGGPSDAHPSPEASLVDAGAVDSSTVDGGLALCAIAGQQYAAGAINDADTCERCQPAVSATSWTRLPRGSVCGSYPVGYMPEGVLVDGTYVWVANFGSGSVTKLRATNGTIAGLYPVGKNPQALAYDGTYLWVADGLGNMVYRLLSTTGAMAGSYSTGNSPWSLAFDGANIWVANFGDGTVSKLSASGGAILGTYPVGANPTDVIYDGAYVWVANSGTVVGTYPAGSAPQALAFDGTDVWVANGGGGDVTKLSASGAVIGTYSTGNSPNAVAFDGTDVWVVNRSGKDVTALSAGTGSLVGTYSGAGTEPWAAVSGANAIWITDYGNSSVNRIAN
jgi:hypothetical protein